MCMETHVFRLNRGFTRSTQINADFGARASQHFLVRGGAAQLTHKKTGEAQGLPLQKKMNSKIPKMLNGKDTQNPRKSALSAIIRDSE